MILEQLLGDIPKQKFLEEFFLKLPFSLPGGVKDLTNLATWDTLQQIFEQPESEILIAKEGRWWVGEARPTFAQAKGLYEDGHTLFVRHAERHDSRLGELAAGFQRDFCAVIDIQLFYTPPSQFGFGWHYDPEDVFILQLAGKKEYSLRKNTVDPWPLIETLPANMRYEREIMPLIGCLLDAGDWLYIPNGYWHRASAKEASISLAVGVLPATGVDAFDFLRRRLVHSLRWRQRLPILGEANEGNEDDLLTDYKQLFADLGDDLAQSFRDEAFIRAFIDQRREHS